MKEKVFVIGHKNPDTDSICSAMAYAKLCQSQGRANVWPARAGSVNKQTAFVLERLGLSAPRLLTDVYPRLVDTLDCDPVAINADDPLIKALELMRQRDVRMLAVVEGNNKVLGGLILKRLTEYLFLPSEGRPIRQVFSSPKSIQSCLQAQAIHMDDADRDAHLDLYVGAMSTDSFLEHLKGVDPRRIVVFVGDRREIQERAINLGIRLLVVTGGANVDDTLIKRAQKNKVSVISSAHDTASSALHARMSTPVRYLLADDVPHAHPDDRLDEIRKVFMRSKSPGIIVIQEEKLYGVVTKSNLLKPSSLKLILVDHNELTQAVSGADQVEILEVIDHHRLGNFHTEIPIRFINQPMGSTCSIIATLYQFAGIEPDSQSASLMLAGLLSDTLMLKSPTTTDKDRKLVPWLEKHSGLNASEFGREILQAGSMLANYPDIRSLITGDFKEYDMQDRRIGVGQVEVVSFHEYDDKKDEIMSELAKLIKKKHLNFVGLLVTDVISQNSRLIATGDKDLMTAIGYPTAGAGQFELRGVLSRKKQLMPHLMRAFREENL